LYIHAITAENCSLPVLLKFLGMSFYAAANDYGDHGSSSPVAAHEHDIPLSDDFDLVEKTFSMLFQNVKDCQFAKLNSNTTENNTSNNRPNYNDSDKKLNLLHLNIYSLQKYIEDLRHFLFCMPTNL